MPPMEQNEFKFPDEARNKPVEAEFEIEIEDDTPPADRGKTPLPKPLVEELEKDELDSYDDAVKTKLKQMRKVWHDERREKEAAQREQQEALSVAQRLINENKRIKEMLTTGGQEYATTVQNAAQMELDMAKRAYKDAYDSGDTDKIVDAQQAMQAANLRIMQARNFRMPSLQEEQIPVQTRQEQYQPAPRPDTKAEDWQATNTWFGKDRGMTAYALGVHEELKENGVPVGSNEYYNELDKTIRRRFPEVFEGQHEQNGQSNTRQRPSTVVAPATRSTASTKVKLKQSQLSLVKKLGITPEQYVREFLKSEANNG